jgi:cation:H+ antiporter
VAWDLLLLAIGSVGLYFGAEWLVRGASGLARTMGVSPLAVGLTVVAYGTSMPELVVSSVSAYEGKSDLALGNVVGSNIANFGLILGLTAMIAPPAVRRGLMRRELPVVFASFIALAVFLWKGGVGRGEGVLLLVGAAAFTWLSVKSVTPEDAPRHSEAEPPASHRRVVLAAFVAVGLAVLLGGGKLFVDGAMGLALRFGMSERLVGLTVVAVGTSLPELAASLVAALRGQPEIAVGNVLGSNIFNVLLIVGAAAVVQPLSASFGAFRFDLVVLAGLTLLTGVVMRTERRVRRFEGAFLVCGYAGYLTALAVRG